MYERISRLSFKFTSHPSTLLAIWALFLSTWSTIHYTNDYENMKYWNKLKPVVLIGAHKHVSETSHSVVDFDFLLNNSSSTIEKFNLGIPGNETSTRPFGTFSFRNNGREIEARHLDEKDISQEEMMIKAQLCLG